MTAMRIERNLLARFCGFGVVLAAVTAVLWGVAAPWLRAARVDLPPWSLAAPLSVVAALWTARRLERLGEHVAIASAGVSRFRLAWPCALVALVAAIVASLPGGGRIPEPPHETPTVAVIRGVDGALWLRRPHGDDVSWSWPAAAEWPLRVPPSLAAVPPGFVPEPRDRSRLRRQLFLLHSPLAPSDHPLDPMLWRWLWLLWGVFAAWWALGQERAARRLVPLVGLLLFAFAL